MNKITVHKPVLLKEILENLNLKKDAILVDGTFGGGGHSVEILKKYPEIKIIAIDSDEKTFEVFLKNFKNFENKTSNL